MEPKPANRLLFDGDGAGLDHLPERLRRWQRFGGARAAALAEAEALRREIDALAARLAQSDAYRAEAYRAETGKCHPKRRPIWVARKECSNRPAPRTRRFRSPPPFQSMNPYAPGLPCAGPVLPSATRSRALPHRRMQRRIDAPSRPLALAMLDGLAPSGLAFVFRRYNLPACPRGKRRPPDKFGRTSLAGRIWRDKIESETRDGSVAFFRWQMGHGQSAPDARLRSCDLADGRHLRRCARF